MVLSVATAKKLVLQKGVKKTVTPKAQRAKLTKAQIAKRKKAKPISAKAKRARLTKAQIAKRRAKGITTARRVSTASTVSSVVNKPPVTANRATVKKRKPATPYKHKQVGMI